MTPAASTFQKKFHLAVRHGVALKTRRMEIARTLPQANPLSGATSILAVDACPACAGHDLSLFDQRCATYCNFRDAAEEATPATNAMIHKLENPGDFEGMCRQIEGRNADPGCFATDVIRDVFNDPHAKLWTLSQVLAFAAKHRAFVEKCGGYGVFMPFRNNGCVLVARLLINHKAELAIETDRAASARCYLPENFALHVAVPE